MLRRFADPRPDPERIRRTQTAIECLCGETNCVPESLAGHRGRCVRCDRPLRVPGAAGGGKRAETKQAHLVMDFKVMAFDLNFASRTSDFYASQLHTFLPGTLQMVPWLVIAWGVLRGDPGVLGPPGIGPDWPDWQRGFWLLAVFAATCVGAIPVARLYRRFSGNSYRDDRFGFARAGGYDIARWAPLLALTAWYAVCRWGVPAAGGHLAGARNPWLFAGIVFGLSWLSCWAAAHRIFQARFGN
jgi:hypothetical protein